MIKKIFRLPTKKTKQSIEATDKSLETVKNQITDKIVLEAYGRRSKLLKFSFLQGILFGLGSAIGGTIVLALVIWLLTRMVDWFPLLGNFVEQLSEYTSRR